MLVSHLFLVLVSLFVVNSVRIKHRRRNQGVLRSTQSYDLEGYDKDLRKNTTLDNSGLWPSVFNLASRASISANATCGEHGREEFCRISGSGKSRCGICDSFSSDLGKKHIIDYAIDGTNKWWQSPALSYGPEFEYVTIVIDLKQVYQVAYIILKTAHSPRPATWVLERSLDGVSYKPWMYSVRNDTECLERFGLKPFPGKPVFFDKLEAICTTFYSKPTPLENAETYISLIHGRPGLNGTNSEISEFTKARYIKIRLMGLWRTESGNLYTRTKDIFDLRRFYYTIKDITIGGRCVCSSHVEHCLQNEVSGDMTGINCESCLPGFYRPFTGHPTFEKPCKKCNCDRMGSNNTCIQDGEKAGTCLCKPGYAGTKCDSCAVGYRGYPKCEKCLCDKEGSLNKDGCGEACVCKTHVEGQYCDKCKLGFFSLGSHPTHGCIPCFCSGVSDFCESTLVDYEKIETLDDWQITDLDFTKVTKTTYESKGIVSMGNYEFSDSEPLYWLAPKIFVKNKLAFYSSKLTFKVHWVIMRGDTSGKPTIGPNIILIGANGLKIAHGKDYFTSSNMTFRIYMAENNWYHIPSRKKSNITGLKKIYYKGDAVSREQFLSVLSNIEHVLLRATFHSDQIEALLEEVTWSNHDKENKKIQKNIEKCSCPSGYTGLSCESCAFGFVRAQMSSNQTSTLSFGFDQGLCLKCDCNGHSESCNPDTGECFCLHNTVGESCERCAPGFYGNPLKGTPSDCKKCACPMDSEENNFSPACQLDYSLEVETSEEKYVCTQCPKGYTSDHCEICDDGYYGNPMEIGNKCKPCDCNGGPCDRVTGQCLSCKGNTEGWRCENCKAGYYSSESNCIPCRCDSFGAISHKCDNETGQCECKEKFTGRTCDRCETGFGNVTALCTPCACDPVGSESALCDSYTGLCKCNQGVEGFRCDACQNLYYGFSEDGCKACNCDLDGSKFPSCDLKTGQCVCKPNFTGLKCERCLDGYWKAGKKCVSCGCNKQGSINQNCDKKSGACKCKSGVGGLDCNACLPGYFGNILTGCKACEFCDREGYICHPKTGSCSCPSLTVGEKCERCAEYAWGYEPGIGCKACNCSDSGSATPQCDSVSGRCTCKPGFEGEKCNKCSPGYYGYKKCRKCQCNIAGTNPDYCSQGICQCDESGCRCKANVDGKHCSTCKKGTFGLDAENPLGCTECFCFGRSDKCASSGYSWQQIRTDEVQQVSCVNGHRCWQLPSKFTGDLTSSYGGYSRIYSSMSFKHTIHLTGNAHTIQGTSNKPDLKIHENSWKMVQGSNVAKSLLNCVSVLTKPCLMIILQNVTNIVIEPEFSSQSTSFDEILLDKAAPISNLSTALSVEKCECPKEYTSLSCQDPNTGYYRYFPKEGESRNPMDEIIGMAKPCQCNEKSTSCDSETGHCQNCTDSTIGPHCEHCAPGYYKDSHGNCSPCLCPSETHNFAVSCAPGPKPNLFDCTCKPGYAGRRCDKCDDSYYGNLGQNDLCKPCNCDPYGSVSLKCDKLTGLCKCKAQFTGKTCSQCISTREVLQNGVCTPCDECTQILFHTIDDLSGEIDEVTELLTQDINPVVTMHDNIVEKYRFLSNKFDRDFDRAQQIMKIANISILQQNVIHMEKQVLKAQKMLSDQDIPFDEIAEKLAKLRREILGLESFIAELIAGYNAVSSDNTQVDLQTSEKLLQDIGVLRNIAENTYISEDIKGKVVRCKIASSQLKQHADLLKDLNLEEKLKDLGNRINNMNELLNELDSKIIYIEELNKKNAERILALKDVASRMEDNKDHVVTDLSYLLKTLNLTTNLLNEVRKKQELVYEIGLDTTDIENHNKNFVNIGSSFDKVASHVEDLLEKIYTYKQLLNFTKDESTKIDASGAYSTLTNRIEQAKAEADEAQKILKSVFEILYPNFDDSLLDQTNLAKAYSDRLNKRMLNVRSSSKGLKEMKEDLDKLKYAIHLNGRNHNEVTTVLHNVLQQLKEYSVAANDIEKTREQAMKISENMTNLEEKVKNINITVQYDLVKNYHKYLTLSSSDEINRLANKIQATKLKLQEIDLNFKNTGLTNVKECGTNCTKNIDTIQDRIRELRNKVEFARETAHSVNIAMSIANCKRRYKLPSGLLSTLSITFKCRQCHLFNLTTTNKEFVTISVEDNRLKINWNNEIREMESLFETDTITLERLGALIKIRSNYGEVELFDRRLFRFEEDDYIEVGGLSKYRGEEACIHKLIFNERIIGFWNFAETAGTCTGCQKDTTNTGTNTLFMAGAYRNVTGAKTINPTMVNVQIFFTTFDENSLIFLAQDKENPCSYIAITLNDGHVQLQVRHVDGTNVTLTSDGTFNNGYESAVTIGLLYDRSKHLQTYSLYVFQTTDPTKEQRITAERVLKISNVFKIKKSEIFIGGIPRTADKTCIPVSTNSFLGYLKPADAEYSDPVRTTSYNNKLQNGELQFTKAWFSGQGFLELSPNADYDLPLRLSFLLKQSISNGFIMNVAGVLDLFIKNDKLMVGVNSKTYTVPDPLNKDVNYVEIIVDEDEIQILVNDYNQNIPETVSLSDDMVLYLGHDKNNKHQNFSGEINSIVVNGNVVKFNAITVKNFKNVGIGREMPYEKKRDVARSSDLSPMETNSLKEMQNTEGCPLVDVHETDPDAVKFGDKPESYIFIKNSFWKTNYTLELQFRTFYPNGVIFASRGPHQHCSVLELQNGRIRLFVKGKRNKIIPFTEKVADGKWHHVIIKQHIIKRRRKLTIIIDGNFKKPMNIPKNNNNEEIYIGGVPNGYLDNYKQLINHVHPFRGCIRSLKINNILQTLIKNRKNIMYRNIGQCFPHVEKGAYFTGDAYAIYRSDFRLNEFLELNLEFKTSEQNGILLSVSNLGNSPALSIELQNGAVVMTVDMGNGAISNVTNKINADSLLCNNQWHNITAFYSTQELTVNVDGIRKSWVNVEVNSLINEIEAPLYIGGLPDNAASGTLRVKENFKGCIRKLKIEDHLMDWTDMTELNNVLLNACPILLS